MHVCVCGEVYMGVLQEPATINFIHSSSMHSYHIHSQWGVSCIPSYLTMNISTNDSALHHQSHRHPVLSFYHYVSKLGLYALDQKWPYN